MVTPPPNGEFEPEAPETESLFMRRLEEAAAVVEWYGAQTPWHRLNSAQEFVRVKNGVIDRHVFFSTTGDEAVDRVPMWLDLTGRSPNDLGLRRLGFKRLTLAKVPNNVQAFAY